MAIEPLHESHHASPTPPRRGPHAATDWLFPTSNVPGPHRQGTHTGVPRLRRSPRNGISLHCGMPHLLPPQSRPLRPSGKDRPHAETTPQHGQGVTPPPGVRQRDRTPLSSAKSSGSSGPSRTRRSRVAKRTTLTVEKGRGKEGLGLDDHAKNPLAGLMDEERKPRTSGHPMAGSHSCPRRRTGDGD